MPRLGASRCHTSCFHSQRKSSAFYTPTGQEGEVKEHSIAMEGWRNSALWMQLGQLVLGSLWEQTHYLTLVLVGLLPNEVHQEVLHLVRAVLLQQVLVVIPQAPSVCLIVLLSFSLVVSVDWFFAVTFTNIAVVGLEERFNDRFKIILGNFVACAY